MQFLRFRPNGRINYLRADLEDGIGNSNSSNFHTRAKQRERERETINLILARIFTRNFPPLDEFNLKRLRLHIPEMEEEF